METISAMVPLAWMNSSFFTHVFSRLIISIRFFLKSSGISCSQVIFVFWFGIQGEKYTKIEEMSDKYLKINIYTLHDIFHMIKSWYIPHVIYTGFIMWSKKLLICSQLLWKTMNASLTTASCHFPQKRHH